MPNVDGLWIGVQKVDRKVYLICTMGDRLTSRTTTGNGLTIIRYLLRANVVDLQLMGDGLTRRICPIGVQKVDERGQNVLKKLR